VRGRKEGWRSGERKFAHLLKKCIVVDNPLEIEREMQRLLRGRRCSGHTAYRQAPASEPQTGLEIATGSSED
jgi:hypothetical protein